MVFRQPYPRTLSVPLSVRPIRVPYPFAYLCTYSICAPYLCAYLCAPRLLCAAPAQKERRQTQTAMERLSCFLASAQQGGPLSETSFLPCHQRLGF